MLGQQIKKLIIVTGEKESVYGELLSSLISLKDDDTYNNVVVGVRDGSVEAVVWTESIYNDNKAQLGSNTKLIFIGKNKTSDAFIPSIRFDKETAKYGINIGSLSNKAVFYIESHTLLNDKALYDEFYDKYIELTKKFDDDVADTKAIKKATHTDGIDVAFGKGAQAVGEFFGGLFGKKKDTPKEKQDNEGTDFFNFGAKFEANTLIPDQMYRYAILNYYLYSLSAFMELQ